MDQLYFTKVNQDYWTPKNQLHKEAKVLMRSYERKIVTETELLSFVKRIKESFEELNRKYPRCKPLHFYSWTPRPGKDLGIHIDGVTELVIYKVNQ